MKIPLKNCKDQMKQNEVDQIHAEDFGTFK